MKRISPPFSLSFLGLVSLCAALTGCDNGGRFTQAMETVWGKIRTVLGVSQRSKPRIEPVSASPEGERFMAFESSTAYLVPGDTNNATDVFVYDRQTKQTTRVSVKNGGGQANGGSFAPDMTPNGRLVVFESLASNLVPNDTNRQRDVFLHDRRTEETSRLSVDSLGAQANNFSRSARLNADGRYVVFESLASNLVPDDTNGVIDIFLRDCLMKRTTRVSVATDGRQADNPSFNPSISPDGRLITFESFASNLANVPNDRSKHTYVHDRFTGKTILASDEEQEPSRQTSHLAETR